MRDPQGINWFKTQYMCQWIKEDEGIKVQFDHDEIWRHVKNMSYFGVPSLIQNFLAVDRSGGSVARTADFNCAVVGRTQIVEGKQALVVTDAKMERVRDSELIEDILIPLIVKHKVQVIIFEEDRHWADFEQNLRRELLKRAIPVPTLRHIPIDITPNSKAKAVKRLEGPLQSGRLFFNAAIPDLEVMLLQLEKFDGRPSHSHKKDDFCDSLQLLASATLPRTHAEPEDPKAAEERKKREEEEYDRARRQAYHDRMVGGGVQPEVLTASEWARRQRGEPQFPEPETPPIPVAPKHFPRGGNFARLPSVMTRNRK
jgi:Terminase RNaseH-like domain